MGRRKVTASPSPRFADEDGGELAPLRAQQRERVDQRVDALEMAQLADIEHVVRTGAGHLVELGLVKAVIDDGGAGHEGAERFTREPRDIGALEQEGVGPAGKGPLGGHVEPMLRRAQRIVEAAAVRRVDAGGAVPVRPGREPGVEAALGAVPVHHIGAEVGYERTHAQGAREVAEPRQARHGQARDAEGKVAA